MYRSVLMAVVALAALVTTSAHGSDTYTIRRSEELSAATDGGRLILFFITEDGRRWRRQVPMSAPFYSRPQPIVSVDAGEWPSDAPLVIDGATSGFPGALDDIDGLVRVQAVLDLDDTERSHEQGPGNLYSEPRGVELSRDRDDAVTITLTGRVEPPEPLEPRDNLAWVRLRSDTLSAFYGRDVYHIAGVAFPPGYDDRANAGRRWPTIYVVPGYGGRADMAALYGRMLDSPGIEEIAPMAVHVVLDPESPLGHHGFVDSPNHGPRGTALVTELIPHLEATHRLAAEPAGRIITGHSSGGWSSVWLQLRWPDVFGGCWSSAPDPVDFSAFGLVDLYGAEQLFTDAGGGDVPSMRRLGPQDTDIVTMTIEQEARMEHAIHPRGGSGQQWDAWEAMFSPRDEATGYPRPLFDAMTGAIDPEVAEHWRRFDITRLVAADWGTYGPVLMGRVRLACGTLDSFYLDRAVARLKTTADRLAEESGGWTGPGYIMLIEGATHGTVTAKTYQRWNDEMRAHIAAYEWGSDGATKRRRTEDVKRP